MNVDQVVVLTTLGAESDAAAFARDLVERRLCACVNILGRVQSIYRWEGDVQDEIEQLLLIKTTRERLSGLEQHLLSVHPYDVPEFVVLPIERISEAYGEWLIESVAVS